MPGSDPLQDPKLQISEALRELRSARHALHESVVRTVQERNRIQEEGAEIERRIAELKVGKARAIDQGLSSLAAQVDEEITRRSAELVQSRERLVRAEAAAEISKTNLPENEARLLQQANDLNARLARLSGAEAESAFTEPGGAVAGELWGRAAARVRELSHEASARDEVAAARAGQAAPAGVTGTAPGLSSASQPRMPADADQMLRELEARIAQRSPDISEGNAGQATEVARTGFEAIEDGDPVDTYDVGESVGTGEPADSRDKMDGAPAGLPFSGQALSDSTQTNREVSGAESTDLFRIQASSGADSSTNLALEERSLASPEKQSHLVIKSVGKGALSSMEQDGRVRVAAVGTGNIFRGAHLPCYPEIAQVRLVAICDPDKKAQDLAYRRYQTLVEAKIKEARERDDHTAIDRLESDLETVQVCEDISEVIELVKPDLVDICTQPVLHAPLAIQALNAGINVMCEKPISRSWLESQRVIEAADRSGKLYQHNENWLWDPDYYTAKKLIDAGAIGEPILMFLATAHGGPEGAGKFWNSDFGGGGALLDNGIHAIGASWFVSGLDKKPTVVKAAEPFGMSIRMPNRIIDGRYQKVTVDDDAHILIRFENKETSAWSTAHVEGSWSHRDSPDTVIIGTTGKINFVAEENRRYAVIYDAYDREARRIQVGGPTWQPWPSSFYGEILNMAECVKNGVPSISDARFGAECSAIVGSAYLSERDGRRGVNVEEFKTFARDIAAKYPDDETAADNALVDALLSAVRKGRG